MINIEFKYRNTQLLGTYNYHAQSLLIWHFTHERGCLQSSMYKSSTVICGSRAVSYIRTHKPGATRVTLKC